jgi:XXXCH domain-containing protein
MDFHALKKDMESVFNSIQDNALSGELPSEQDANEFFRLAKVMQNGAKEDWADECEDFVHLASQLQMAVRKGNVHDATLLAESLNESRTYCHRMFGGP